MSAEIPKLQEPAIPEYLLFNFVPSNCLISMQVFSFVAFDINKLF